MDCVPRFGKRHPTFLRLQPEKTHASCHPCQARKGQTGGKDVQVVGEAFWKGNVVAAMVSNHKNDAHSLLPQTKIIENYEVTSCSLCAPSSWHAWLEWLEGYPAWFRIEWLVEHNHFFPLSLVLWGDLQDAGVSVFSILQVCHGSGAESDRRAMCIERYKNELELMIGLKGESPEVLIAYAKRFRATGERRNVHALSPLRESPRFRLGPANGMPDITILDLLRWISGPLAKAWQPYDPLLANSRVLAFDLRDFLENGCPEHNSMNREVMLAAVKEDGLNLQLAPEMLRANREIVLEAVSKDGSALEFVGKALQADRDVVHAAVRSSGLALRFATKKLQADRGIVLTAVNSHGRALLFASPECQKDANVIMAAARQDPWAMQFAPAEMCGDPDFVLKIVSLHGTALRYASENLRANRKIVRAAVKQDGKALRLASDALRADLELQTLARPESDSEEELPTTRYKPRDISARATRKMSGR